MSDLDTRSTPAATRFAGELMKGRLEAEGISVMMKGEGEGPYRTGPVYLWVPEDEERARAVVDAVDSGAFAVTDEDVMEASEPSPSPSSRDCSSPGALRTISAWSTAAPCGPSSGRTCDVPSRGRPG